MDKTTKTRFPWLAWIILGLLWIILQLPYRARLLVGKYIGKCLLFFPTSMKHTTEINLQLCFPELSPKQRNTLMKKNFDSLGMALIESAMAWLCKDEALRPLYQLHGYEHIEKAFAQHRGILLIAPHFLCVELAARFVGQHHQFGIFYREHKKSWIAFLHKRFRQRHFKHYIPSHRIKRLLTALKQNQAIWYAYDIDPGAKRGIFAPFFGEQAASLTTVTEIVRLSQAAVIPMHYARRDDNSGYDIYFHPRVEPFPHDSVLTDATQLNAAIEAAIRQHPDQYVWQYKRFKTRPPGEKRFYYSSNFPPRWIGPRHEQKVEIKQ